MTDYRYRLNFSVRDYECDIQGIVNNAVYQNYLEHTRHEFLKACGLSFAELTARKVNLVVVRAELDYKSSLKSGDDFYVALNVERVSPLRFAFLQDIYRLPDEKLMLCAKIIGTGLNERGRPELPDEISRLLGA